MPPRELLDAVQVLRQHADHVESQPARGEKFDAAVDIVPQQPARIGVVVVEHTDAAQRGKMCVEVERECGLLRSIERHPTDDPDHRVLLRRDAEHVDGVVVGVCGLHENGAGDTGRGDLGRDILRAEVTVERPGLGRDPGVTALGQHPQVLMRVDHAGGLMQRHCGAPCSGFLLTT